MNHKNSISRSLTVYGFSLFSLFIFLTSSNIISNNLNKWVAFWVGIALMACAVPLHCCKKKITYVISVFLNSFGGGFCFSALLSHKDLKAEISEFILGVLPSFVVLTLILLLVLLSKKRKRILNVALIILSVALIIVSFELWMKYDNMSYMFGFFCAIISAFYSGVFLYTANKENRNIMRDISFGSFGFFMLIAIIVLIIISGGEVLEGLGDIFGGGSKDKKNKANIPK
ncbi:MAG: hypothetical protein E7614_03315 [Ruminococcaceae bacterium]|nr:hypothetical protein [Oscillospiraceae bacterium]